MCKKSTKHWNTIKLKAQIIFFRNKTKILKKKIKFVKGKNSKLQKVTTRASKALQPKFSKEIKFVQQNIITWLSNKTTRLAFGVLTA